MYLKDYNIMKINNGLRLVNQSDPDNRFDPMDTGLFEPGDTFTVSPTGWLEFTGNKYNKFEQETDNNVFN